MEITPITITMGVLVAAMIVAMIYFGVRVHKEQKYTAAHELGHAAACKYYGVPVHKVIINQMGTGGYTTFDLPKNTKNYAVIIAAGYVAEENMRGRPLGVALRGGAYEGDMHIMKAIVGDDSEQIKYAIQRANEILTKPEVAKVINDLIPRLVDRSELSGDEIRL